MWGRERERRIRHEALRRRGRRRGRVEHMDPNYRHGGELSTSGYREKIKTAGVASGGGGGGIGGGYLILGHHGDSHRRCVDR